MNNLHKVIQLREGRAEIPVHTVRVQKLLIGTLCLLLLNYPNQRLEAEGQPATQLILRVPLEDLISPVSLGSDYSDKYMGCSEEIVHVFVFHLISGTTSDKSSLKKTH